MTTQALPKLTVTLEFQVPEQAFVERFIASHYDCRLVITAFLKQLKAHLTLQRQLGMLPVDGLFFSQDAELQSRLGLIQPIKTTVRVSR